MRLSYKDFTLLIGILVAVIIALSTWMYGSNEPDSGVAKPQMKKEALNTTTSIIIDHVIGKVRQQSPAIHFK